MICDGCWHKNNCADYGEKLIHCEYFEPMTEQEYIQTCNTEQLAEELLMATMSDVLYAKIIPCKTHEDAIRVVREWLKQPHQ